MQFEGAVIKRQGVTFGIIIVKPAVLRSQDERARVRGFGVRVFGRMPIVLMAQDSRGVATHSGRRDIVSFLSKLSIRQIPWKRYTIS
jgi:hypothetical protein